MELAALYTELDRLLLVPFLFPSDPLVGYWLGNAFLAAWAVCLGHATSALLRRANRRYLSAASHRALREHGAAMAALRTGDRAGYEASNKLANDAFGTWFFHSAAVSISSLWPAFLAAGWLSLRFEHVAFPIPFTNTTASFVAPLILCVVAMRLALAWVLRGRPAHVPCRTKESGQIA